MRQNAPQLSHQPNETKEKCFNKKIYEYDYSCISTRNAKSGTRVHKDIQTGKNGVIGYPYIFLQYYAGQN